MTTHDEQVDKTLEQINTKLDKVTKASSPGKIMLDNANRIVTGLLVAGIIAVITMVSSNSQRLAVIESNRFSDADARNLLIPISTSLSNMQTTQATILEKFIAFERELNETKKDIDKVYELSTNHQMDGHPKIILDKVDLLESRISRIEKP